MLVVNSDGVQLVQADDGVLEDIPNNAEFDVHIGAGLAFAGLGVIVMLRLIGVRDHVARGHDTLGFLSKPYQPGPVTRCYGLIGARPPYQGRFACSGSGDLVWQVFPGPVAGIPHKKPVAGFLLLPDSPEWLDIETQLGGAKFRLFALANTQQHLVQLG